MTLMVKTIPSGSEYGVIAEIPSHPNYGITRYGRVFRVRGRKGELLRFPLEMSRTQDKYGYWRVNIACRCRLLHALLLETFVGPRPTPWHHGRHLDGNAGNYELSNLAWGTAKENRADRCRHEAIKRQNVAA